MGQVRWVVWLVLGIFIMASVAYAQDIGVNMGEATQLGSALGVVTGDLLIIQVNSSQFWDDLDSPADIFLNDLGDVDAPGPSNNQVLTFNTATSNWEAQDSTGGGNVTLNNTNIAYVNVTNNFTENQLITGNLNVTGNLSGRSMYGSTWQHSDTGITINLLAVDQHANITTLQSIYNNGFVFDGNHTLTVTRTGIYNVQYTLSLAGGSNKEYVTNFAIDGEHPEEGHGHHTAAGAASINTISVEFYTQINASQEIWVEIEQVNAPITDPVYLTFSMTVEAIDVIPEP